WTHTRIYRNVANDTGTFYRVTEIPGVTGGNYTDSVPDATIQANPRIDLDGPKITASSLVLNMVRRDGATYSRLFDGPGTLQFTGRKGDRALAQKEFQITATTTVLELYHFMSSSMGIQIPPGPDSTNPIPTSAGSYGGSAGGAVTADGRLLLRANNGVANAISIGLSGMKFVTAAGAEENVNMPFTSVQTAKGESAVADFIAYDSLGIDISVRLTAVLESRTSTATTYRWYADSPGNDPDTGSAIAVGTGLIRFDGNGNFVSSTEDKVSIDRRHVSSASPLEFRLNFNQLSGLATNNSTLAVSRQDGSAPGTLTSFIVGEDGTIRGVFSNGITRDLGQIVLARFGNPTGLEQKGQNMFAAGVNSGLPVIGRPNEQGIGSIIAGAQELSNTDIGGNLIDLILASTMYRGNTRVITTAQQMFDELLALRR
ncbi:MAG: flagellar hook-basal body complex protein, partial [Patescibacteria group bacterium]|nr:flagellar hook-basal body complex protein [Patescibacteria group bacterium]